MPTPHSRTHRLSGRIHPFETNRSPSPLLNDDSAVARTSSRNYIAHPTFAHVTAAELAIDSEVEKGSVAESPALIEPDALPLGQRAYRTG